MPLTAAHAGVAGRLLTLATAGGVATLIGIALNPGLDPKGLATDTGPFQTTLASAPAGTAYVYSTVPLTARGETPVHLLSAHLDAVPAGITGLQIVAAPDTDPRLQVGRAADILTGPVGGTPVSGVTIVPGQSWSLLVSFNTSQAGHTAIGGLTVDYTVDGKHRTRHYASDVEVTATS